MVEEMIKTYASNIELFDLAIWVFGVPFYEVIKK